MPRLVKARLWQIAALATVGLVIALILGYHGWQSGDRAVAKDALGPVLDRRPLTLVRGVHMLGGMSPSVAYVIETAGGLVLIDAGLQSDAQELRRELAELGLGSQPIRAILLTHAHGDHSGGARALRAATGAKIYAGRGDSAVLRAGGPPEAFFSTFQGAPEPPHPTPVDVELDGDSWIAVGGVRLQALSAPGHTPGSTCYLLQRDGLRLLFSGDVIMSLTGDPHSDSRLAQPLGTYAAYLAPVYRGDARAYLGTLRRLRALPVPDLVLPGHPGMDPVPPSPRMTPERWTSMLDHGIAEMEQLVRRYQRDGANFLDGVPKRLLPGFDYLGARDGRAVYALVANTRLLLVNAPGGPGLTEFVKERLQRLRDRPLSPSAVLLTSGNSEARSGLEDLCAHGQVRVYVVPHVLAQTHATWPRGAVIETVAALAGQGWPGIDAIPLKDAGDRAAAYTIRLAGKTVLITDGILEALPDPRHEQIRPGLDRRARVRLLRQLRALKPQLWTPEKPVDGQNANLYDDDWDRVLHHHLQRLE